MKNYWTCSKFADWVRGTPVGGAKSSEEWDEWRAKAKIKKFRYWLAETGIGFVQEVVSYIPEKINSFRYYLNNRFVVRSNSLTAHKDDIKPGEWRDLSHRILPCLFNELVDFVEIECAWINVCFSEEKYKKFKTPFWRKNWYFRWFVQWRSPEAGIDYLVWASGLKFDESMYVKPEDKNYNKPTPQAEGAKEILALYYWWKNTYKKRPDVYEVSGWSDYCNKKREEDSDGGWIFSKEKTKEEQKQVQKMLKDIRKLEAQYEKEEEEMMIRLIKVRDSLWT
jgi:hypothetical protein